MESGKWSSGRAAQLPSAPSSTPGKRIYAFDDFVVTEVRHIGSGAWGSVKLVEDINGDPYVVKVIKLEGMSERAQTFTRAEIEALVTLRGTPGVVYFYNQYADSTHLYLLMEYIEGPTVGEYLKRAGLTLTEKYDVLASAAQVLADVHARGYAHRDIKPDNMIYNMVGGQNRVYVIDFGFACDLSDYDTEVCTLPLGSPYYMDFRSQAILDRFTSFRNPDILKAMDVWGLGISFYYIWYGRMPAPYRVVSTAGGLAENQMEVVHTVDTGSDLLDYVLSGMLQVLWQKRPTMQQVADLLRGSLAMRESVLGAVRDEIVETAIRHSRRNRYRKKGCGKKRAKTRRKSLKR